MSHGGPYLFDSIRAARRARTRSVRAGGTINAPIGFGAYVRSVAALLGVPPPAAASEAQEIVAPVTR